MRKKYFTAKVLWLGAACCILACKPKTEIIYLDKKCPNFDSLKQAALKEVDDYKSAANYQVDTMRANLLKQAERIKSYGNVTIIEDSCCKFDEAGFDETGKPVLRKNNSVKFNSFYDTINNLLIFDSDTSKVLIADSTFCKIICGGWLL